MKIIGYTTGTFDMFHFGHVNLLKTAKALCDVLIVGVTSDKLCKTQKGKKTVMNEQERIDVLSACKYVDCVVIHNDETKEIAQERYKFDILFIGDDWFRKDEYSNFEKKFPNIKVVYIPYTNTISSTCIRQRIKDIERS